MRRLLAFLGPWAFLLAWVTVMAFWVASYVRAGTGWHLTYGSGAACLFYLDPATHPTYATDAFDRAPDHSGWYVWQDLTGGTISTDVGRFGFRYRAGTRDGNTRTSAVVPFAFRLVEVPFWFLAAATAVPAAVAFARGRRRRGRAEANVCFDCGYDLRGITGRCPECGTLPTPADVTR